MTEQVHDITDLPRKISRNRKLILAGVAVASGVAALVWINNRGVSASVEVKPAVKTPKS